MTTPTALTTEESHRELWEAFESECTMPLLDVAQALAEQGFERAGGIREVNPVVLPDALRSYSAYIFVDPASGAGFSMGVRFRTERRAGFLQRSLDMVLELLDDESLEPVAELYSSPLLHLVGPDLDDTWLAQVRTRLTGQASGPVLRAALNAFSR